MNAKEMLEETCLNWTVRPESIITESGIKVTEKIAIVRENNTVLGVHGKGYVPYQNIELMELLYKISQSTGLVLHSSGEFENGKKIWMQLKSDDLTLGNDRIEGYLSGINSFDGSTNLSFGNSNLTISCKNTFWKGYHQMNTKLRHSGSMKIRIEEILASIDPLLEEEKETFKEIVRMSETGFTPTMLDIVKKRLFDLDDPTNKELSTRKTNQLFRFGEDLKTEISTKGETVWGLFSGITRYTTHSASRDLEKNHENKMFGRTGMIERQLFNELNMMVKKETVTV